MRVLACLLMAYVLAASVSLAADPIPPSMPKQPVIRLPVGPVVKPSPSQPAEPPTTLKAGEMYVIECKAACRVAVYSSPDGLVTVAQKTGPRDITGKFAGGNGVDEDKRFEWPILYVVKAAKTGRVLIEITPYGFAADTDIEKVTLDVTAGPAPAPPAPPGPVDPLTESVKGALSFGPQGDAKADVMALAAVYRACAEAVNLDAVKTGKDMFDVIHNASVTRVGTRLSAARTLFGKELNTAVVVKTGETLTPQHKADAVKQLNRFAAILESLGK